MSSDLPVYLLVRLDEVGILLSFALLLNYMIVSTDLMKVLLRTAGLFISFPENVKWRGCGPNDAATDPTLDNASLLESYVRELVA